MKAITFLNFRLSSIFLKIFSRIKYFLQLNSLLPLFNTVLFLVALQSLILLFLLIFFISAFEKGFQVETIYMDKSKAFDKVSHKILLRKLYKMGFHSTFLKRIKSYLEMNGIKSTPFLANSGVSQCILGPIFFILYVYK